MKIQLIQGEFSAKDALDLITHLIHVKIKFHERKITEGINEEDVKMREMKIKRLQKDLYETRLNIEKGNQPISLNGLISLN